MTDRRPDQPAGSEPGAFLASFFGTAKTVLFSPQAFYAAAKNVYGFRQPFLFLLGCVTIHTVFVALTLRNAAVILFSLFNGLVMPFATAGLLFLVLTRLFNTSGTYEQTYRVVAYSAATALVSWIPLAGFVVELYRIIIIAIGLRCLFSVKTSQAVVAIAIVIFVYIAVFSLLGHFIGPTNQTAGIS